MLAIINNVPTSSQTYFHLELYKIIKMYTAATTLKSRLTILLFYAIVLKFLDESELLNLQIWIVNYMMMFSTQW